MKLSNRIQNIIKMCPYSDTVFDIGCDHGYISIELVNKNKCIKAYAVDINPRPLSIASKNIFKYNLNNTIECVLSDGFTNFSNLDNTGAVIAGMGGSTISNIIQKDIIKVKNMNYILIQPNSYSKDIRKFIYKNKIYVHKEDIVYSDGVYYEYILIFPKQQENLSKLYTNFLTDLDYDIPLCVFDNIDGRYNDFIKFKIFRYQKVLNNMIQNNVYKDIKYDSFRKKIDIIRRFLV